MKSLTAAYPELICQAFPADLLARLKELVKAQDCDAMVSQLFPGKIELMELSFLDSCVLIRGHRIEYDFDKIAKDYAAKIVATLPGNAATRQLLNQYLSKAIPSLRGMVELEGLGDPPVTAQAALFDKIMAAPKLAGESATIKEDLTNTYLGMYSTGKNIGSESFQKEFNAHTSLDSITYYQPKLAEEGTDEATEDMPGTSDMLKNMLVQGAVNYFAPGAMQALQIMSNLFMQGQIADAVRDKNKELQEAVKDYVDKSLDRDKYQLNAYRAEHDRNINSLIIEGKTNRLKIFEDAGNKFDFKKQLVKEQVEEYSSYYYYLLERLRESFTQYLWAYKKWYGISYREDLLRDPNAVRLILDPQIRYLTFSNYTSLGKRKGTVAVRQWERIIPSLLENHDDRKIEGPDEKQLSEFAAQFEDIAFGQWAAFKKWIVTNNPADNEFKFRFNVDLLDRVSTERWTISMGDRLQDKLLADKPVDLPAAFRLLGINIIFTDTLNAEIRPNKMFTLVELRLDSITPSMVNYGDRFIAETYSNEVREFVDLRNFPVLEKVISGRKIKYFKSLWGIPLQSSFVLTLKKNLSTAASAPTRKSLGDVRAEGFYFTTKSTAFTRSLGDAGTLPLVIDGKTYKVNFGMNDILRTNADLDIIRETLKLLQKQVNQKQP
jgi:hypothetical protein